MKKYMFFLFVLGFVHYVCTGELSQHSQSAIENCEPMDAEDQEMEGSAYEPIVMLCCENPIKERLEMAEVLFGLEKHLAPTNPREASILGNLGGQLMAELIVARIEAGFSGE